MEIFIQLFSALLGYFLYVYSIMHPTLMQRGNLDHFWKLLTIRYCSLRAICKAFWGRLYRAFSVLCCFKCVCKTQCSFVASARRNAHEMALSTCIHANRFSCKHEICSQECTSELYHKKKADNITLPTFQPILFPSVRQHTEFLSGCNNCTTVSQPLRNISAYCFFLLRSNI